VSKQLRNGVFEKTHRRLGPHQLLLLLLLALKRRQGEVVAAFCGRGAVGVVPLLHATHASMYGENKIIDLRFFWSFPYVRPEPVLVN
jgi:hypothetical protein